MKEMMFCGYGYGDLDNRAIEKQIVSLLFSFMINAVTLFQNDVGCQNGYVSPANTFCLTQFSHESLYLQFHYDFELQINGTF